MKAIEVLVSVVGKDFSYIPGKVSAPDDVAKDLVGAGHAKFLDEKGVETNEETIETVKLDELDKSGLVDLAAQLKVGAPSTLERWGEDRLKAAISEAAAKGQA